MAVKVVTATDFHSRDFEIVNVSGKPKVALKSANPATGMQTFSLSAVANVRFTSNDKNVLWVKGGVATLHLDFNLIRATSGVITLANLPNNAPTFSHLIEGQVYEGGVIWLDANARTIYASGLNYNKRYVINLTGFV